MSGIVRLTWLVMSLMAADMRLTMMRIDRCGLRIYDIRVLNIPYYGSWASISFRWAGDKKSTNWRGYDDMWDYKNEALFFYEILHRTSLWFDMLCLLLTRCNFNTWIPLWELLLGVPKYSIQNFQSVITSVHNTIIPDVLSTTSSIRFCHYPNLIALFI